jgi:hypothetical protein
MSLVDDIEPAQPTLYWVESPLMLRLTDEDRVTLEQLKVLLKKDSVDDVVLELIRRAAPSPNGSAGYEVACFGCGKKFTVKRRPIPGRHSWCETCKASGEPAAQRARDYRARRAQ